MQLTIRDWTRNKINLYLMPLNEADVAGFSVRRHCPACDAVDSAEIALEVWMAEWTSVVSLAQCRECTHIYYLNPPSDEFIDNYYRTSWNKLSGQTPNSEVVVGTRVARKLPRLLQELGITDRSTRIHDVGCGMGHHMAGLIEAGYENTFGSELQAYRLASLEKRFPGHAIESDFSSNLPDRYDVIYSNHVMEHVYSPREMFDYKVRHLEPTGIIIVSVPDAKFEPPFQQLLGLHHLSSFTVKSLARLGESFGFKCQFWRGGRADELCAVYYRDEAHIAGAASDCFFREDELDLSCCDDQIERLRKAWQPQRGQSTKTFHVPLAPYTDNKSNSADVCHTTLEGMTALAFRAICRTHNWLIDHNARRLANLGWKANQFLSAPGRRLRGFSYVVVQRREDGSPVPRISWPDKAAFVTK